MRINEQMIEEQILTWLNVNGFFAWKNHTTGFYDTKKRTWRNQVSKFAINGASDIIAVKAGNVYFIEVKTAVGKQSRAQKSFESKINEHGGNYLLVRSIADIKKYFS